MSFIRCLESVPNVYRNSVICLLFFLVEILFSVRWGNYLFIWWVSFSKGSYTMLVMDRQFRNGETKLFRRNMKNVGITQAIIKIC